MILQVNPGQYSIYKKLEKEIRTSNRKWLQNSNQD